MFTRRQAMAGIAGAAGVALLGGRTAFAKTNLRYGHMNAPASIAGKAAEMFAEAVARNTNGDVTVTVYPNSQLGKLQELAEAASAGTIGLTHNTAGGIGSLYKPFAALDTAYLYNDVDHLMRVVDVDSPVMQSLNKGLISSANVRVLFAFYFGTRNLTTNFAVYSPEDLEGKKIRAIPFPIYMAAVEGLGATPVPVDWSEVPTALATGVVAGQENPVNVVLAHKLYDVQSHLMLTGHIMGAEIVAINEDVWQGFDGDARKALAAAGSEVREKASALMRNSEAQDLADLKKAGMTVIGPQEGLKLDAFRSRCKALVNERFGKEYGDLYAQIDKLA